MNVPAIAQKTFNESRNNPELLSIVIDIFETLRKIPTVVERVHYVHQKIEEFNSEVFSHPLVQKMSPCKMGCTACCHTQVSVTQDEASILARKITDGLSIDTDQLDKQRNALDDEDKFYSLSYAERKCIFLDDQGACKVYLDRPSVCRTNAVMGDSLQCDSTTKPGQMTLVKTLKSDLAIYAFYLFSNGGVLPNMVAKELDLTVA